MSERSQLWQSVDSLREGDVIVVSTNQDYLTDKTLTVREIQRREAHAKAGGRHYRIYCEGHGEPPGQFVIHRDPVHWSGRRVQRSEPELFYIDNLGSPPGADERSEGEITDIG